MSVERRASARITGNQPSITLAPIARVNNQPPPRRSRRNVANPDTAPQAIAMSPSLTGSVDQPTSTGNIIQSPEEKNALEEAMAQLVESISVEREYTSKA
jgi:hypothetical protein